jgi:hypothetical protein
LTIASTGVRRQSAPRRRSQCRRQRDRDRQRRQDTRAGAATTTPLRRRQVGEIGRARHAVETARRRRADAIHLFVFHRLAGQRHRHVVELHHGEARRRRERRAQPA